MLLLRIKLSYIHRSLLWPAVATVSVCIAFISIMYFSEESIMSLQFLMASALILTPSIASLVIWHDDTLR